MKFTCEKEVLQNACSAAIRAVPSKSPIQALEGFKIDADSMLKITGYDLKKGIYTSVEADIAEPGSMVVNAKLFSEMIRRMPDGNVTVTCSADDKINVRCGKIKYNMSGMDADSYPELTQFDTVNTVVLPQKVLKSMINQTLYAVSKDEIRPVYTGSLVEISGDELTIVSVDGYRLAKRTEKIEGSQIENCSFVVPGFTLSDIEKFCGGEGDVTVSVGDKYISFEIGETVVISRRLEGEFLNYKKSVPTDFRFEVSVSRAELMSVIERVALFLSERNGYPVRMTFNENSIECNCSTSIGVAQDSCMCEGSGDGLEIGFNDRYFIEALKAADEDELKLCLNTASSPCVIKAANGSEKFVFMILPVRLRAGK